MQSVRRLRHRVTGATSALIASYSTSATNMSADIAAKAVGSTAPMRKIEELRFDNKSVTELPIDPIKENYTRTVPNAIFSLVEPTPVINPQVVAVSEPALRWIDLDPAEFERPDFAQYFSGNKLLPGARPAAHCYCGHQFGGFSGQLGDGATMYLGEIINSAGERVEIQFKGAGKTPYSRGADGRKVLRSSIREFLCSELMASLGVPTTRAGTVVTSDTMVQRDIFYTGDVIMERATIITRLAPTFLRFGSFEIFKLVDEETGRKGPSFGNVELLRQLLDYVVHNYYPAIEAAYDSQPQRYLHCYEEIVRRTARLVACWQAYGWCHGVLNTDNMSIMGVTIDYGPFGWMDRFDPDFICNASDNGGRYSYENQPQAVKWNCIKLGEAFAPLMGDLNWRRMGTLFDKEYEYALDTLMKRKLGLVSGTESDTDTPAAQVVVAASPYCILDGDEGVKVVGRPAIDSAHKGLVQDLFKTMSNTGCDFTNTFRALMDVDVLEADKAADSDPVLEYLLSQVSTAQEIANANAPSIPLQQVRMLMHLAQSNPRLAAGMESLQDELAKHQRFEMLRRRTDADKLAADRVEWQQWLTAYRSALKSLLGETDHAHLKQFQQRRHSIMRMANPKYVLRNWVAHEAIKRAEAGDFGGVRALLVKLQDPYGLRESHDTRLDADLATSHVAAPDTTVDGSARTTTGDAQFTCRPPPWALDLKVT